MAQIATPAPQKRTLALWSLVLLGVGLLSILPLSVIDSPFGGRTPAAPMAFDRVRIAYFEFGISADTLWLADPTAPANRIRSFSVRHAPEYGIIPSLSPDSRSTAYLVLPPETAAPGPDAPAQLWVASLSGGEPSLLASDADLLVPAVWSPDGKYLVFRRSDDLVHLYTVAAAGGAERRLATSQAGLFPVGFTGNSQVYYVELGQTGSALQRVNVETGEQETVAQLSTGLTRDWSLSPDGSRLAFLEMTLTGQTATSRAFVLDLKTGALTQAGGSSSNAFSPRWDASGALIVGQLADGMASNGAAIVGAGGMSTLKAPERGFDVPLAANQQGGVAVTSFDGSSVINPGRPVLVVVGPDGVRREISAGEVTFLGWITP